MIPFPKIEFLYTPNDDGTKLKPVRFSKQDIRRIRLIAGAVLFLILAHLGWKFFEQSTDYSMNLVTELLGVLVTILVVDQLNAIRIEEQQRSSLLFQLSSPREDTAVEAFRQLRLNRWLTDEMIRTADSWSDEALDRKQLPGITLVYAQLQGAQLQEINLQGANLSGANLESCELREANLADAVLFDTNLRDANLHSANLAGAELIRAKLYNANLTYAKCIGAKIYIATLDGCDLSMTDFAEADLSFAGLRGAKLSNTNFKNSNLSHAKLQGAIISTSCNFEGANLSQAKLQDIYYYKFDMDSMKSTDQKIPVKAEMLRQAKTLQDAIMPSGEIYNSDWTDEEFAQACIPKFLQQDARE